MGASRSPRDEEGCVIELCEVTATKLFGRLLDHHVEIAIRPGRLGGYSWHIEAPGGAQFRGVSETADEARKQATQVVLERAAQLS